MDQNANRLYSLFAGTDKQHVLPIALNALDASADKLIT